MNLYFYVSERKEQNMMGMKTGIQYIIGVAFLLGIFISFSSCTKENHIGKIKEGIIEYDIEYLNTEDISMSNLLPKRMVIKFKNNNTVNKIESFSGIVSFTHLSNYKKNDHTTLVKLLNKKFRYNEGTEIPSFNFEAIPNMELTYTDESKQIAGYNCKRVKVSSSDTSIQPFDLYYTDEIKIVNPNRNTPFEEIQGVLLQFDVKMYNFNVRFKANSIVKCNVANSEFKVPKDYKTVNKDTMEEIINLFQ